MSLKERMDSMKEQEPIVDIPEQNSPIVVDAKPFKRDIGFTIDNALDFKKKQWRNLYYDIITHPSPFGLYSKDFGDDAWDLRRFEKYIDDTFTLIHLPSVLAYKGARIKSKKKGYLKYE